VHIFKKLGIINYHSITRNLYNIVLEKYFTHSIPEYEYLAVANENNSDDWCWSKKGSPKVPCLMAMRKKNLKELMISREDITARRLLIGLKTIETVCERLIGHQAMRRRCKALSVMHKKEGV
jgi:hypothetical protein